MDMLCMYDGRFVSELWTPAERGPVCDLVNIQVEYRAQIKSAREVNQQAGF